MRGLLRGVVLVLVGRVLVRVRVPLEAFQGLDVLSRRIASSRTSTRSSTSRVLAPARALVLELVGVQVRV